MSSKIDGKMPLPAVVKVYLANDSEIANRKALLALKSCLPKVDVLSSDDFMAPGYPCVDFNGSLIFGASSILRLAVYGILQQPFSSSLESLIDMDEFTLSAVFEDQNVQIDPKSLSTFQSMITSNAQLITGIPALALYLYPIVSKLMTRYPLDSNILKLYENIESTATYSEVNDILKQLSTDQSTLDWSAMGLLSSLKYIFTAAISKAFRKFNLSDEVFQEAVVIRCSNATFGDFQCNNAMGISKALKEAIKVGKISYTGSISPKDIADAISKCIPTNKLIESVNTAPNGFININLAVAAIVATIADITTNGVKPPNVKKRNVLVDFSSPNIAKEMHVGHLRSTIIGDSLCRLLEFCGHNVMRVNHVGDWGTQFGMLITYLKEAYPDILTNPPNISDLTLIYKESKKRFDADEQFKETSRLNVVNLQSGEEGCRKIWHLLCDISRKEFQRVYDALGVTLDECGESFYNPMIPDTNKRVMDSKVAYEDEGMLLVKLPHFTIPLILRKSDGGYGYDSTDMAAIYYRLFELKRDWVIVITDAGQSPHFQMIFDTARAMNWITTQRVDHIGFGVVQGEDGKRFKTRSSETVRLIDLLDEAKVRMRESLNARNIEGKTNLSSEEMEAAAQIIGYGAVKYFDLKQNPTTNYIFSYDRMLDTKGDTAVYLLFAYARLASILRKAHDERGIDVASLSLSASTIISLDHPAERALGFELLMMNDVVQAVLTDLSPNKLCDYLKNLSVKFTDFVTQCHVLNAAETNSRILLCEATRRVLSKCFELLGIGTLERI